MAYRIRDEEERGNGGASPARPPSRGRRAAMRTMSVLPTMFTLGNALCGFLSIFFASRPVATEMLWGWTPMTVAAAFIFLGMVFDALDGRIARLTNYTSEMGGQLDSMADMVTCGVAPAFLAVQLVGLEAPFLSEVADKRFDRLVLVIACIYVSCAALRLARFNLENVSDELHDHLRFKGLPSPGAAGTVASLVLLHEHYLAEHTRQLAAGVQGVPSWPMTISSIAMVAVMLLCAFAMVSNLGYVHVANRYLRGQAPVSAIAKAVILLLLLAIAPQESAAGGFVIYALSAPTVWLYRKVTRRGNPVDPVDAAGDEGPVGAGEGEG